MSQVIIIDDDAAFTQATAALAEQRGFSVLTAYTLREARTLLQSMHPNIVLLDVMLPDGSGLDLIQEINPETTRIIVMTGHPTVDVAVDSLRARVSDFLVKPVEPKRLLESLGSLKRAIDNATPIVPARGPRPTFEQFVGRSGKMLELYKLIERVAPSTASVLIRGESGTGKELVAAGIHARSERRDKPFLSLNCGAVSSELIRSELFGHERGSFTGAARQHLGYFERADGGTLFLDEVTEMPLELQVQLLRVLETARLQRVGGDREIAVNVRIVAATNRNPHVAIEQGQLREDLYFRLAVFPIQMPTLAERSQDIPLLAEFFLDQHNREGKTAKHFADGVADWLQRQRWRGNVRELKNAVQHAFILAETEIHEEHFPQQQSSAATGASNAAAAGNSGLNFVAGATPMEDVERQVIFATLKHNKGNKPKTAEALGVSLKTLYNRLKQYEQDGAANYNEE